MCPAVFLHQGERETSLLKFQVIDNQTAVLHVQGFKGGAPAVDEQVHVPVAHLLLHMVAHQAAQCVKALSHVTGIRIQPVAHRVVQVKHGFDASDGLMSGAVSDPCRRKPAGLPLRDRQSRRLPHRQGVPGWMLDGATCC